MCFWASIYFEINQKEEIVLIKPIELSIEYHYLILYETEIRADIEHKIVVDDQLLQFREEESEKYEKRWNMITR